MTDDDRAPWLATIHGHIVEAYNRGESLVVGCSALKQSYRAMLADDLPVKWVYLKGARHLIESRMRTRAGHFMKANMVASQFAALEEPADAIVVDIDRPPAAIVEEIVARLARPRNEKGNAS